MQDDERLLLMSPLPHSAGFLLQTAFLRGATVFLEHKFDPELALRRIVEDRVTYMFMVPTMIYRVLDAAAKAAARSAVTSDDPVRRGADHRRPAAPGARQSSGRFSCSSTPSPRRRTSSHDSAVRTTPRMRLGCTAWRVVARPWRWPKSESSTTTGPRSRSARSVKSSR